MTLPIRFGLANLTVVAVVVVALRVLTIVAAAAIKT